MFLFVFWEFFECNMRSIDVGIVNFEEDVNSKIVYKMLKEKVVYV